MSICLKTEMLEKLKNYFHQRDEIGLSYLFGSAAMGKMGPLSDIDIAVLVEESKYRDIDKNSPYGYRANMIADLMSILHKNEIEVVILNYATPLLVYEVVKNGLVISCSDEKQRLEFEIQAKKRYLDTKRLREIQWLYISERIGEGKFGKVGVS